MSDEFIDSLDKEAGELVATKIQNNLKYPDKFEDFIIQNGMAEALGLGYGGFPYNQAVPGTSQLSQANTIFINLRYYLVSNFRQILSQAYVEFGLVQTIIDVPVDDALRGGVEIRSKILSEDEIQELLNSLDRDDDLNIVGQAAKWNRLFGGAGVLILTDQDPSTPLVIEEIRPDEKLEFRALDMWELFYNKQNMEGYDPTTQTDDFEFYDYYGVKVHKSRVMRLKGITAPSFIRPRLRGWGFSVVETLVRSINQYLKATDLAFEVLDEFKVDIYKIKNLVNTLLSPNGEAKVRQRVDLANRQKNYQNAVVMDSEDDWDHKTVPFTGLGDAMKEIRMQVASDMRMPLTKLFGISASGFNSGEDDIEVYNSMVESQVRNKIKYVILRILEIKCQKLFGMVPDDLSIDFKPLREMSAEQEENVKTQKYARVSQAKSAGELTTLEYREACNKGNLFDITLDTDPEALSDIETAKAVVSQQSGGFEQDSASEGTNDPEHPKDTDNPGADRLDTQAPKATEEGGIASKGAQAPKPKEAKEGATKEPSAGRVASEGKVPKEGTTKKQNAISVLPRPYSSVERLERIISNSAQFDLASYRADGGDAWIDARRELFFDKDKAKDKALWMKAEDAAHKAGGQWQMVVWIYKKLGGAF